MLSNLIGCPSEKFTHHVKGVPRTLVAGIRVGFLKHRPEFWLKVLLEVFPKFARAA
jgi:hypothetical protein